jgi:hypothetical protein
VKGREDDERIELELELELELEGTTEELLEVEVALVADVVGTSMLLELGVVVVVVVVVVVLYCH